jgi:hypothetical protein
MITLTFLGLAFIILASISEAIMDKLQFHYHKSIFKQNPVKYDQAFWDASLSWQNKYKEGSMTEPKFYGSTTLFVFTTDAWHLFKFLRNVFLFIGLPLMSIGPINILISIIVARVVYGLVFTYFFDKVLSIKQLK